MDESTPQVTLKDKLELWFLRFAAGGLVPARWYLPEVPPPEARQARTGLLSLEIVSHCWRYAHLLAYQLSSLALYPPTRLAATMTVFHAAEDEATSSLLRSFGELDTPNVTWNWRAQRRSELFRRAIGRNLAALQTTSDWIWFTDCDILFHRGCLDALADVLQKRRDAMVFPRRELVTGLLDPEDLMLRPDPESKLLREIDTSRFSPTTRDRATGGYQIVHGDVARACGYCAGLRVYQKPSPVWTKATEDRAFRWLLRTQGVGIDLPGVYRIRHAAKGRYQGSNTVNRVREALRRWQSRRRYGDRDGRIQSSESAA
jgi:hypothetical protein